MPLTPVNPKNRLDRLIVRLLYRHARRCGSNRLEARVICTLALAARREDYYKSLWTPWPVL